MLAITLLPKRRGLVMQKYLFFFPIAGNNSVSSRDLSTKYVSAAVSLYASLGMGLFKNITIESIYLSGACLNILSFMVSFSHFTMKVDKYQGVTK